MKRKLSIILACAFLFVGVFSTAVYANDVSLLNNNTLMTSTNFVISDTGLATVAFEYYGYEGITTGAKITVLIEKRNLLFFWPDVVEKTYTVTGYSYDNVLYYQLEEKGTYRCTVTYTVSGTGGEDDVIPFERTVEY